MTPMDPNLMSYALDDFAADESEQLYATQGGGTAAWCDLQQTFVFVTPPKGYTVGAFVPAAWAIAKLPAPFQVDNLPDLGGLNCAPWLTRRCSARRLASRVRFAAPRP